MICTRRTKNLAGALTAIGLAASLTAPPTQAAFVSAATVGSAPTRADATEKWLQPVTVDTAPAITEMTLFTTIGGPERNSVSAWWAAGAPDGGTIKRLVGPAFDPAKAKPIATGAVDLRMPDDALPVWYSPAERQMKMLAISAGDRGGPNEYRTPPTAIPGTEGIASSIPVEAIETSFGFRALLWVAPDKSGTGLGLVQTLFDVTGGPNSRISYARPSSVPVSGAVVDELVVNDNSEATLTVAYRTTASDGTRSIIVRQGTTPTYGALETVWGPEQTVCQAADSGALEGCSQVQLVDSAAKGLHVLYRETPPGRPTQLRERVVSGQLSEPHTLGDLAGPYSLAIRPPRDVYYQKFPSPRAPLVAAADGTGVRVWRMSAAGTFDPPTLVSGGPASNASIAGNGPGATVSWTSGSDLWVARQQAGAWRTHAVAAGTGSVVASGVIDEDAPPTAWYVADTGTGQVLRMATLDEEGPLTSIWLAAVKQPRGKKSAPRLRATYIAEDFSGVRKGIIQVRAGRSKGHMGAWRRLDKHAFRRHPVTVDRTVKFRAKPGRRYCIRARTIDGVGNIGRWGKGHSGPRLVSSVCVRVKK